MRVDFSIGRAWRAFAAWRHTGPFWAGVWCILGGAIIALPPVSVIKFLLVSGTIIVVATGVGVIVVLMGLFLWHQPQSNYIAGRWQSFSPWPLWSPPTWAGS